MKTELQKIGNAYAVMIPQAFLDEFAVTDAVQIRLENQRIIIEATKSKKEWAKEFVDHILKFRKDDNKGALAALKCADNPAKEDKSWEYLGRFIDNDYDKFACFTIAAAIAKSGINENGEIGISQALAIRYKDEGGNECDQAKIKLRRLLACDSSEEVCRVLRPLFNLINSKGAIQINYVALLKELLKFDIDNQSVKSNWAKNFYRYRSLDEANQ